MVLLFKFHADKLSKFIFENQIIALYFLVEKKQNNNIKQFRNNKLNQTLEFNLVLDIFRSIFLTLLFEIIN